MKTSTSSKRKHSLAKGMLIYALIFLIIIAIGLGAFYFWAEEYEQSRPSYAVNSYLESLTKEHVSDISAELISLAGNNKDEAVDSVYTMLKSATPAKDVASSNNESQSYYLKSNDTYIEKITLSHGEEGKFGFRPWVVTEETILSDNLISAASVKVPDTWTVKCDGTVLSSANITGESEEFKLLEGFYEEGFTLPKIVSYTTGAKFGDTDLAVFDEKGNEHPLDELSEEIFADNCTQSERAELEQFCKEYITRYVKYTSTGVAYGSENYSYLLEIVDRDSILREQIVGSQQGFGFASSLGDAIQDIRVLDYMNVGDNRYVCRIEYDLETYGSHATVTDETYPMRLMVTTKSGSPMAMAYLNY